jgi:hypothetical protein
MKRNKMMDFLRYQRGEMTGEEMNSFERDLQKDPFLEEASEGFALISPDKVSDDYNKLHKQLQQRTTYRRRVIYYRIAASIAALMVISSIFILFYKSRSDKQLVAISEQPGILEITESKPISEPLKVKEISEINAVPETGIEKKHIILPAVREPEPEELKDKDLKTDEARALDNTRKNKADAIAGYATSKNAAMFLSVKAAENISDPVVAGEMETPVDSQAIVGLSKSEIMKEDAVIAESEQKRSSKINNDAMKEYIPPLPVDGKEAFDIYIRENLVRPDNSTTGQRVVVVISFLVHSDGTLDSIRIVKSPDKLFSDEAIRLIKSGPQWKPAEDKGKQVEDRVTLNIIFQ